MSLKIQITTELPENGSTLRTPYDFLRVHRMWSANRFGHRIHSSCPSDVRVSTELYLTIQVFWGIMLCTWVKSSRRLQGLQCAYHQGPCGFKKTLKVKAFFANDLYYQPGSSGTARPSAMDIGTETGCACVHVIILWHSYDNFQHVHDLHQHWYCRHVQELAQVPLYATLEPNPLASL